MFNPTLVVMAAGIGSRYGGLKQIDPIGPNGELIIDYSIYDAMKAGFDKVIFIIRKEIEEAFREKVGKSIEGHIKISYVYQELDKIPEAFKLPENRKKPWGTGQAILCCRDVINSPFAVINADDFYGASSYKVLADYLKGLKGERDYCMVGYVLGNTLSEHGHVARGVCKVNEENFLAGIVERTKIKKSKDRIIYTEDDKDWIEIPKDSIVSLNIWGFTPSFFSELDTRFYKFLNENLENLKAEYLVPTVVGELIKENKARVKVLYTKEKWFGVTYREDIMEVKKTIRELIGRGLYPEKLWR